MRKLELEYKVRYHLVNAGKRPRRSIVDDCDRDRDRNQIRVSPAEVAISSMQNRRIDTPECIPHCPQSPLDVFSIRSRRPRLGRSKDTHAGNYQRSSAMVMSQQDGTATLLSASLQDTSLVSFDASLP